MPRYAMNIADLTRYDEIVRGMLIAPVIQGRQMVEAERGRLDGAAVVMQCDDVRALAVIQLLRTMDEKAGRYLLRAYQEGARGGWSKAK